MVRLFVVTASSGTGFLKVLDFQSDLSHTLYASCLLHVMSTDHRFGRVRSQVRVVTAGEEKDLDALATKLAAKLDWPATKFFKGDEVTFGAVTMKYDTGDFGWAIFCVRSSCCLN